MEGFRLVFAELNLEHVISPAWLIENGPSRLEKDLPLIFVHDLYYAEAVLVLLIMVPYGRLIHGQLYLFLL